MAIVTESFPLVVLKMNRTDAEMLIESYARFYEVQVLEIAEAPRIFSDKFIVSVTGEASAVDKLRADLGGGVFEREALPDPLSHAVDARINAVQKSRWRRRRQRDTDIGIS